MNPSSMPLGTAQEENENALLGTLGAFLFALVGGGVYILSYEFGFISAVSALVGVICAIKGYAFFAKQETNRGIVISVIMAALVIVIAWYLCFGLSMMDVYRDLFDKGEIDFVPTLFEYVSFYGFADLTVNPGYFFDLLWSFLFGGIVCWSYVANRKKRAAAIVAFRESQEHTQELHDLQLKQAVTVSAETVETLTETESTSETSAPEVADDTDTTAF